MAAAMNLFLTGFMGTGKSTVGALLATRMDRRFIDTDLELTRRTGQSIAEIFEKQGEEEFRRMESRLLSEIVTGRGAIVSLGGGTLKDPQNLAMVLEKGFLLGLEATPEELSQRLARRARSRPLIREAYERGKLPERVKELLDDRAALYGAAHLSVSTSGKTPQEVVLEIVKRIAQHPKWVSS